VGGLIAAAVATPPPPADTLPIPAAPEVVGIGVHWGPGLLPTRGQRSPFAVQGLAGGGVGVSKVHAVGQVYQRRQVADLAGTYGAVGADAAVGGGAGIMTMRHQHGVIIHLQSTQ
jgi:hypothetical protein